MNVTGVVVVVVAAIHIVCLVVSIVKKREKTEIIYQRLETLAS